MPFRFDNYASELTPATDWKPGDPWDQHYTQPGLDDRDQQIEDAISNIGLATQRYESTAARDATHPQPGQVAWVVPLAAQYLWDGTGWVLMSEPERTSFAPVVTPGTGAFTTLGATTFSYQRSNGMLDFELGINVTTNGTAAGNITATLPVAHSGANRAVGVGREAFVTGVMVQCITNGTQALQLLTYNNAYPGGNGTGIFFTGRYQMASRYS